MKQAILTIVAIAIWWTLMALLSFQLLDLEDWVEKKELFKCAVGYAGYIHHDAKHKIIMMFTWTAWFLLLMGGTVFIASNIDEYIKE